VFALGALSAIRFPFYRADDNVRSSPTTAAYGEGLEELAQECMKRADAANDDNELVIDFASPKDRPKERY
jgi:hypothetical protein